MSQVKPSQHLGMGAIPYPGGVTFRVWAPHAEKVFVTGTFNQWNPQSHPLAAEDNGYWSADIAGVKPRKDQYQYVIINQDQKLFRIDPYAQDVTNSTGNTIVHDPDFDWEEDPNYRTPPWNEMVIYEMHIGTFHDQPGGAPGNLDGVIEKLTYLHDLGINVIQLMPPAEFAGGFSWGYNPAHMFAIESDYGGSDALKKFVKAAHKQHIAVIFDVVYNHLGPSDLDLWQFDGWSADGKGGIYFYNDWRSHTPWGDTRPDYGRSEVRQYIRDNALMWLEEFHIDGLRWDATAYIRNVYGADNDPQHDIPEGWALMQWINDEINTRQPWKINIAEDLRDSEWITKATGEGGAGFDAQWDGHFVHPIRKALITTEDQDRDMYAVQHAIEHRYGSDAFERIIYTESHDEVANGKARVPEEIWPGHADSWAAKKRSTLGAALVFTTPGIPMLFQGQELLEDAWFHDQDPIDWSRKERFKGILQMYRDLIHLRRNRHNRTRGLQGQHVHVFHTNNTDKLIAFHRWDQGGPYDSVVVVANFGNRSYKSYTIGFPRAGYWKVRFNGDWAGYDRRFGNHLTYNTIAHTGPHDNLPAYGNIGIGPYSVILLSQDS